MSEKFDQWKKELEEKASEVVEVPQEDIDKAVYSAAVQMGDAENIKIGDRPIEETIKELEAEGWDFRGPVSGKGVFEAVAEEGKEIKIVGTGKERYLFEKSEGVE